MNLTAVMLLSFGRTLVRLDYEAAGMKRLIARRRMLNTRLRLNPALTTGLDT